MKTRNKLWLTAGLVAAAGWAPSAVAAGLCLGGPGACAAGKVSARAVVAAPSSNATGTVIPAAAVVAPVDSTPFGQTYGRWAAQWWQWAFGTPTAVNPVLDPTGANCAQRQVGDVWFLAGAFSSGTVTRTCAIPAGKALFFPTLNIGYGAWLNDPPETRTDEFMRAAAVCNVPANISVWIDGAKVANPTRFFTGPSGSQSPLFNVQMPPLNIFGVDDTVVPELVLSPTAEQGYYLFVRPMRPGAHTIKWLASGCTDGNSQDITYNLTVLND